MNPLKLAKTVIVSLGFAVVLWSASAETLSAPAASSQQKAPADGYVGSETCQSCHEDQFNSFSKTAHSRLHKAGWKSEAQGCESCHGPGKGHVEGGGDKSLIRTFADETSKQISETCLTCHSGKEEHINFKRGEHWRNDVGCTDCHTPHASARMGEKLVGPFAAAGAPSSLQPVGSAPAHSTDIDPPKMLIKPEAQLCMSCHTEQKSQFTMPFHHKVLEGAMKCSDCHNPHGGAGIHNDMKQTRASLGNDVACIKCHTDKQGPFVFEHEAVKVEGCATCHDVHGSANPRLLKRNQVQQLCIECHSDAHAIGSPNTPSFHNIQTLRFQNCTTCHAKIHGSNTHQFFFR